jgi:hypothetical protein
LVVAEGEAVEEEGAGGSAFWDRVCVCVFGDDACSWALATNTLSVITAKTRHVLCDKFIASSDSFIAASFIAADPYFQNSMRHGTKSLRR